MPMKLGISLIMITRHSWCIAVHDLAGPAGEAIPDRLTLTAFLGGAFNLYRGCRHAPDEIMGELV